jgi:hypothetical protein
MPRFSAWDEQLPSQHGPEQEVKKKRENLPHELRAWIIVLWMSVTVPWMTVMIMTTMND